MRPVVLGLSGYGYALKAYRADVNYILCTDDYEGDDAKREKQ
jgi:hypothetical protein